MIPSVSGGIGHVSRTATLAREILRMDPTVEVEYLLDTERLRTFNVDATAQMGFRPRFLPPRTRDNRDAISRACLGDADVIVDDCSRHLLPLRRSVPHVGWISLAMHPIGDELFMDWPVMAQMDAVIWPYAPLVQLPAELTHPDIKVLQTGPFLAVGGVPDRHCARRQLGFDLTTPLLVYAPRGFPFGRDFGHLVLSKVYQAAQSLRAGPYPRLQLVLLAVNEASQLRGIEGVPDVLPDWVVVKGVVTPSESLLYIRAANAVVAEGTSTMHEAAALLTPVLLAPGPIAETTSLTEALLREDAGYSFSPSQTTVAELSRTLDTIFTDGPLQTAMLERAKKLITGGGGVAAAATLILKTAAEYRMSRKSNGQARPERTGS
jgi:hypothetical protein